MCSQTAFAAQLNMLVAKLSSDNKYIPGEEFGVYDHDKLILFHLTTGNYYYFALV